MPFTPMDAGYVMVADRHAQFVKDHPNGRIETFVDRFMFDPATGKGMVVIGAKVWKEDYIPEYSDPLAMPRGPRRSGEADGTGFASMPIPGPTSFTRNSEVENAETSAVGRALAMIGYHPKERFSSDDEIIMKTFGDEAKSSVRPPKAEVAKVAVEEGGSFVDDRPATAAQLSKLMAWGRKLFSDEPEIRKFVFRETGKRKRADLTRSDITKLFDLFKVMESTGGTVEKMDGVE